MLTVVRAGDAPFPASWWGTGPASAGMAARPDVGTYGRYSFAGLPPLPFDLAGDFGWLPEQEAHDDRTINQDGGNDDETALLRVVCGQAGPVLPARSSCS
jgi:hypothetical protein